MKNGRIRRQVVPALGVALVVVALAIQAAPAGAAATTERVSVDSSETEGNDFATYGDKVAISADGRFVAFGSKASNLVPGDTNGTIDIFLRDRQTGQTERVNLDETGQQMNSEAFKPSVSGDGRYVVWVQFNGIYIRDRVAATTQQITNQITYQGTSITPDGRYVAFVSPNANLVPGDTNGNNDTFVYDRQTDTFERVSVTDTGGQAEGGDSEWPTLSDDGRYVSFQSRATNLVPGDTNSTTDAYVRDRVAGTTERASLDSNGQQVGMFQASESTVPSMSFDGRYVVFSSWAAFDPADTNGTVDVYLRDLQADVTELVSVDSSEGIADGYSMWSDVSADGRYVAFSSTSTDLVASDTNGTTDVFLRDRTDGTTVRVSETPAATDANGYSDEPEISADGSVVVYHSDASNLVSGDTNGTNDVFAHAEESSASTEVSALSDAHLWVGLKNSDDQGTRFDVKVELLKNGAPVASGLTRCVIGVTRNAAQAKEVVVPWDAFPAVQVEPGDVLALRVSTRIGTNPNDTKCTPGHNNAVGLRLYYDATSRASRFDITITPDPSVDEYLRSDGNPCVNAESTGVTTRFLSPSTPTATSAKCKDSTSVNFAGGNPFKVVGTWSAAPQP